MEKYLLLAISTALISGCTAPDIFNEKNNQGSSYEQVEDADMIATSHHAAENLMAQASYLQNDPGAILITSVADITDLDASSALGLMISEQIGNRFAQYNFPVVDIRSRNDVKIRENQGEFMLSRDVLKISQEHAARGVLLGTYAVGKDHVFISTRLVRPSDNRIIASYDFELPMGPDAKKLLKSK